VTYGSHLEMTDKPICILVENESTLGPVFSIDPQRCREAMARRPGWADRIELIFSTDLDRFHSAIGRADALIGWRFPHRDLVRLAPRLRWVHLTGAGAEHLAPFDWLPAGVALTNNRGVHAPKCEEFVAMALLFLANQLPALWANQQQERWSPRYTRSIADRRATVVGVGNMGGAAALACRRLGLDVVGVRRSGAAHPAVRTMYRPNNLKQALDGADFVIVSTPLTSSTRQLIGAPELACLAPGAALINIARGGVVDNQALSAALDSGHLSGAWLDVFEQEPLPAEAMEWRMTNTVITPHCSSDDAEAYIPRTLELILDNVERLLAGRPLTAQVDPVLEY
jgi:phosphoglycerate dehydrogenase-like enzyme